MTSGSSCICKSLFYGDFQSFNSHRIFTTLPAVDQEDKPPKRRPVQLWIAAWASFLESYAHDRSRALFLVDPATLFTVWTTRGQEERVLLLTAARRGSSQHIAPWKLCCQQAWTHFTHSQCCRCCKPVASLVLLNSVTHALVKVCMKGSLVAVYREAVYTVVHTNLSLGSSTEKRRNSETGIELHKNTLEWFEQHQIFTKELIMIVSGLISPKIHLHSLVWFK